MIGLSGLSVGEIRAVDVQERSSLSAIRQSAVQVWPSGRPRLTLSSDWEPAHQTDPTCTITVVFEISADGGSTWTTWAGFTSEGSPGRGTMIDLVTKLPVARPGFPGLTSPRMETNAPPAGVLVRTREMSGPNPVSQGLIVRAT